MHAFARSISVSGLVAAALIALSLVTGPATAADDVLTDTQKKQVEDLVRQYITDHPEVIVEAIQQMQARQEQEKQARAEAALKENKQELEADPEAPVIGNPNGRITIVEFFDYRCSYCKRVFPAVMQVLNDDPRIRYVFKEFPILGPESVAASKASLAVWRHHKAKYMAFHRALMTARGGIPEARILSIAEDIGIDKAELKKNMADPEIDRILERNYRLAQELNINGTPAFVIGGKLVPGAIDADTMKRMVEDADG